MASRPINTSRSEAWGRRRAQACRRHAASPCQNWARCPGALNLRPRPPHHPGQHCHLPRGGLGQLHPRGTLVTKRVVGRMWHTGKQRGPLVPPLFPWLLRAGIPFILRASPTCLYKHPPGLHAFPDCTAHRTPPFVALCGQVLMSTSLHCFWLVGSMSCSYLRL